MKRIKKTGGDVKKIITLKNEELAEVSGGRSGVTCGTSVACGTAVTCATTCGVDCAVACGTNLNQS